MSSKLNSPWLNGLWVFLCTTTGVSVAVWSETLALVKMRQDHLFSPIGDEVWTVGALLGGALCGYVASICIAFLVSGGLHLYTRFVQARSA